MARHYSHLLDEITSCDPELATTITNPTKDSKSGKDWTAISLEHLRRMIDHLNARQHQHPLLLHFLWDSFTWSAEDICLADHRDKILATTQQVALRDPEYSYDVQDMCCSTQFYSRRIA
jgi:hypothetical protein